jgi:hypothetical protein
VAYDGGLALYEYSRENVIGCLLNSDLNDFKSKNSSLLLQYLADITVKSVKNNEFAN